MASRTGLAIAFVARRKTARRRRFMKLKGIPVRIFDLNLLAPRSHLDLVSEPGATAFEGRDHRVDVLHVKEPPRSGLS